MELQFDLDTITTRPTTTPPSATTDVNLDQNSNSNLLSTLDVNTFYRNGVSETTTISDVQDETNHNVRESVDDDETNTNDRVSVEDDETNIDDDDMDSPQEITTTATTALRRRGCNIADGIFASTRVQLTRMKRVLELIEMEQKNLETLFETLEPVALQSLYWHRRAQQLQGEAETAKEERDIIRATVAAKDERIKTLLGENASELPPAALLDVQKDLRCAQTSVDRAISRALSGTTCTVCMSSRACILFLPCKHVSLCGGCLGFMQAHQFASSLSPTAANACLKCPICRSPADDTMRLFV